MTRNGVEHDLSISPYKVEVSGLHYSFSSKLHMKNFVMGYEEHRKVFSLSLSRRVHFPVSITRLADVALYRKIENRGCRIEDGCGEIWELNA